MTRKHANLLLTAAAALALAAITHGLIARAGAARELRAARDRHASTLAAVERVLHLRATAPSVSLSPRPPQDIFQRVNAALASESLTSVTVQSVSLAGDRELSLPALPGVREQSVRVELSPITLRQLGDFLAAWERREPLSTFRTIDLNHRGAQAAGQPQFTASLVASTTYLASQEIAPQ